MNQTVEKTDGPSFRPYLKMFTLRGGIDNLPGGVFRRAKGIIKQEGIKMDRACQEIAEALWREEQGLDLDKPTPISKPEEVQALRERIFQRILGSPVSYPGLPEPPTKAERTVERLSRVRKIS